MFFSYDEKIWECWEIVGWCWFWNFFLRLIQDRPEFVGEFCKFSNPHNYVIMVYNLVKLEQQHRYESLNVENSKDLFILNECKITINSDLDINFGKISFNKFCTKDVVIMPNITSFFFLFFFLFSYLFVHSQALVSFRYKITIYVIYCLLYIIIWSKLGLKSIFSQYFVAVCLF